MNVDLERSKRIFQKLLRIAPNLMAIKEYAKSKSSGYMDLSCDILESGRDYRRIALSHYWEHPSGDLIPDPDMEVSVFFDWELAEATSYQDVFTYENAYPVDGEPPDLVVHNRLNEFLEQWLQNLADQGHNLAPKG
jgi:uncharacterized protein YqiB (DUF1249 family)